MPTREEIVLQDYISAVRDFMRDYSELNQLIDGVENDDDRISRAVRAALDTANMTVPITSFTLANFPYPTVIVDLAVGRLLESLALLLQRNNVQVQDAGGIAAEKIQVQTAERTAASKRGSALEMLVAAKRSQALVDAVGESSTVVSGYNGGWNGGW